MKIAPIDIRQQRFSVKFRGFDPQEVDTFLEMVADEIEELDRENGRLREEQQKLEKQIEELEANEVNVKKTLLAAQTLKEDIVANAKKEAELVLRDARSKSDNIIGSTQSEASNVRDELTALLRRKRQLILNMRSMLETHLRMFEAEEKVNSTIQKELEEDDALLNPSNPTAHPIEQSSLGGKPQIESDSPSHPENESLQGPPKTSSPPSVFIPGEQQTDT